MSTLELVPLNLVRLHHAEFGQLMVRFFEDFAKAQVSATADADFKILFDGLQAGKKSQEEGE